jgi:hypothetical protein
MLQNDDRGSGLVRLRDLPGVQGITDLCRNPRNFDYPQSSYTAEKIAAVSIGLFGITQWDTEFCHAKPVFEDDDDEEDSAADESDEVPPAVLDAYDLWTQARRTYQEQSVAYEAQFHPTRVPWSEIEPFWLALGWDLSDGKGAELVSAHCFARQIIAAARGLVPGAVLTLDGSGAWGAEGAEQVSGDTLEERLKREADAFIARRRR